MSSIDNYVFCPPLLGKPDPAQERPLQGSDNRGRVVQKACKGSTSWYRIFNELRPRYKASNGQQFQGRAFEVIASKRRKATTQYWTNLPDLANQLQNPLVKENLKSVTLDNEDRGRKFLAFLDTLCESVELPHHEKMASRPLLPAGNGFYNQNKFKNFYDYLLNSKANDRLRIDKNFFKSIETSHAREYEKLAKKDPELVLNLAPSWKDLDPKRQPTISDIMVVDACIENYGLQLSAWNPSHTFEQLVNEIDSKGPLAVAGRFGPDHYVESPKKFPFFSQERETAGTVSNPTNGRAVYGWSKGATPNELNPAGNMILLVGAEKVGKLEVVYYIDSSDASDPKHPEEQRIFVMSYKKLTSIDSLCDLHGVMRLNAPPEVGYAVYSPDKMFEREMLKKRQDDATEAVAGVATSNDAVEESSPQADAAS